MFSHTDNTTTMCRAVVLWNMLPACFAVYLLLCGRTVMSSSVVTISPSAIPWQEAAQVCRDIGLEIFNPQIHPSNDDITKGVRPGEVYWTSVYTSNTPFYWKLGCFAVKNSSESKFRDFDNSNSLTECSNFCINASYVGLTTDRCYCFSEKPTLGEESVEPCKLRCAGDEMDICGEVNKISVYGALNSDVDKVTLEEDGNCVSINKESLDDIYSYYDDFKTFTANNCSEPKTYFCKNYTLNNGVIESENILYTKEVSWKEAQSNCISLGMEMAYIDGTIAQGLLIKDSVPDGSENWIGLYRHTFTASVQQGTQLNTDHQCRTYTVLNGSLVAKAASCLQKNSAICYQAVQDTTTETAEGTTMPQSTTATTIPQTTTVTMTTEGEISTLSLASITKEGNLFTTISNKIDTTVATTSDEIDTTVATTSDEIDTTVATTSTDKVILPHVVVTQSMPPPPPLPPTMTTKTTAARKTSMKTTEINTTPGEDKPVGMSNQGRVGASVDVDRAHETDNMGPPVLAVILIVLSVVFLVCLIIAIFAYIRYRRRKREAHLSKESYRNNAYVGDGEDVAFLGQQSIANEPSPQKSPPNKPVRSSMKGRDAVTGDSFLLSVPNANCAPNGDPKTRDDLSWNLPYIDASREALDNLDDDRPIIVKKSVLMINDIDQLSSHGENDVTEFPKEDSKLPQTEAVPNVVIDIPESNKETSANGSAVSHPKEDINCVESTSVQNSTEQDKEMNDGIKLDSDKPRQSDSALESPRSPSSGNNSTGQQQPEEIANEVEDDDVFGDHLPVVEAKNDIKKRNSSDTKNAEEFVDYVFRMSLSGENDMDA